MFNEFLLFFVNLQIVCINYVNSCRLLYLNGIISDQDADDCVTCVADLATKAPHVRAANIACIDTFSLLVLNIPYCIIMLD